MDPRGMDVRKARDPEGPPAGGRRHPLGPPRADDDPEPPSGMRLERHLARLLEAMPDGVCAVDREWRLVYANRRAGEVMGRSPRALVGRRVGDWFPGMEEGEPAEGYRQALAEQAPVTFEIHYPPRDLRLEVTASPGDDLLSVHFRDVTRRKRAEAALREKAQVIQEASDVVIIRDRDHRITFWNPAAERVYGYPAGEVTGRRVEDVLAVDPDAFREGDEEVRATGRWRGELTHRRRNGEVVEVEAHWTLLPGEEEGAGSVVEINTDVTGRKRLESQMLQTQRLESLGTLAGGIAHDLNNVLGPILMAIGLLRRRTGDDPEAQELLDLVEGSARRGADMVRQVLSFARGTRERDEEVRVSEVIADVERMIRETFPRSVELRTVLGEEPWPVRGDATQIHQVLMNLAVNARDAMPEGGTLRIAAENVHLDDQYASMTPDAQPGPYVRIEVSDSGEGIPPGLLGRIFDPFFTTKELGKGTGLGLATVRSIVRGHGGFVDVDSEPGRGTAFRVFLPAAPPAEAPRGGGAGAELGRGRGEAVLVADDEAAIRTIIRRTLEAAGYRVFTAEDGADAVAVFASQEEPIRLVITDMTMPVMEGPAVVRAFRRMDPGIPVVAISGLGPGTDEERLGEEPVNAFLSKPFTADVLLRTVRRVLDRPGG